MDRMDIFNYIEENRKTATWLVGKKIRLRDVVGHNETGVVVRLHPRLNFIYLDIEESGEVVSRSLPTHRPLDYELL